MATYTIALVALTGFARAQTPTPSIQVAPSSIVAQPTYTSIPLEVTVNRPAAEVWKRVGRFCDIGEWMGRPLHDHRGKGW
jgi:hypothetical protein